MELQINQKIVFLKEISEFLMSLGLGQKLSDVVTFVLCLIILFLLIKILKCVVTKVLTKFIAPVVRKTETKWDDFLINKKFYDYSIKIIAILVVLKTSHILFIGFGAWFVNFADLIIKIYLIYTCLQLFNSIMNAVIDFYESDANKKHKSVRSLVQSVKIVALVIVVILILSLVFKKNPTDLLVALGASAAIISLVFRDTILGFVASIQVSAQDMVRVGDWVEMPSRGADGIIKEINITTIKVQNWDNTITMIPTYAMVSESFVNWRSMEDGDGRRFKRSLFIDINSVSLFSQEQLTEFEGNNFLNDTVLSEMKQIVDNNNTSFFLTNLGLYRAYVEAYLKHYSKVAGGKLLMVRYIDCSEHGINMQIYAFSKEKNLIDYEHIVSDVIEHVIIVASFLKIRFYQKISDNQKS